MKRGAGLPFLLYVLAFCLIVPRPAAAGGAWVPDPGHGNVELGYSDKVASDQWDSSGHVFGHFPGGTRNYHDFKYGFLSGELGLVKNLSATFLIAYLDGLEGAKNNQEHNAGLTDAWYGLKYKLRGGDLPMALSFVVRTPWFYDLPGPYNRHLFNSDGSFRGVSPEWRGLLKYDYTLSYLISRPAFDGGWMNFQAGYTWRDGAPADETPVSFDLGYPLPFWHADLKLDAFYVHARGNNSRPQPDDRFGARPTYNFNKASMFKAGIGLWIPLGASAWAVDIGYDQWLWGRSARRYKEPHLSINRNF
ncbi:MAG: hypothetical protein QOJ16_507 [Acidobacteriota bacterium]|jgi:hypothetical protein|nr:hypothetical protein [Acidobacteriota bacterium]